MSTARIFGRRRRRWLLRGRVSQVWEPDLAPPAAVQFLKLRITYVSTGLTVDESACWFPRDGERKLLTSLPEAKVVGQMMKSNKGV
jgi:hypothetical protein